jgi:hypothetical protein
MIESLKSDVSGRVMFGKYVPTKEEVFQHAQVHQQETASLQKGSVGNID